MLIRRAAVPWPVAIARGLWETLRDGWEIGVFASKETQLKATRRITAIRLMEQRADAKREAAARRKYFADRGRSVPTNARHFDGYYDSVALKKARGIGKTA